MKGITEDFDPLALFKRENRPIPKLSWSLSESFERRKKVLKFLKWNNMNGGYYLRLQGGAQEKIEIDTLYH